MLHQYPSIKSGARVLTNDAKSFGDRMRQALVSSRMTGGRGGLTTLRRRKVPGLLYDFLQAEHRLQQLWSDLGPEERQEQLSKLKGQHDRLLASFGDDEAKELLEHHLQSSEIGEMMRRIQEPDSSLQIETTLDAIPERLMSDGRQISDTVEVIVDIDDD